MRRTIEALNIRLAKSMARSVLGRPKTWPLVVKPDIWSSVKSTAVSPIGV